MSDFNKLQIYEMKKIILFLPVFLLVWCDFNTGCVWNDCADSVCHPDDYICLYENWAIDDFSDIKISELWNLVLKTLSDGDMNSFSEYVSPFWVKFSAYWYFLDEDVVLTRENLKWDREKIFIRWNYEWSGEPIELSINDYFDRFVYNHDFLSAPEVNEWTILWRWNSLVNANDYFQNSECIEYYIPGFVEEYEWMDRESLILIFDKDTHYLIWIAHEQWTV